MKVLIENSIKQLQQIQEGKIWIGTNFKRSLNSIPDEEAFVVANTEFHTIAEIIAHLTIWRNETILKIKTSKGSLTDEHGDDWCENSKLIEIGWTKIKSDYDDSLTEIIKLLKSKKDSFLAEIYFDTDYKDYYPYEFLINGMLHHDLYHLGQIGLIIKLLKL